MAGSGGRSSTRRDRLRENAVQATDPLNAGLDLLGLIEAGSANLNQLNMTNEWDGFDPNLTHAEAYENAGLPPALAAALGLTSALFDPGPGGEAKAVRRGVNAAQDAVQTTRGTRGMKLFRAESAEGGQGPVGSTLPAGQVDTNRVGGTYWTPDALHADSYGMGLTSGRIIEGNLNVRPDRMFSANPSYPNPPEVRQRFGRILSNTANDLELQGADEAADVEDIMRRWGSGELDDTQVVTELRDAVGHQKFGQIVRDDFDAIIQMVDDNKGGAQNYSPEVVVFNDRVIEPVNVDAREDFGAALSPGHGGGPQERSWYERLFNEIFPPTR